MDYHEEADGAMDLCRIRAQYVCSIIEAGGLPLLVPSVADESALRQYLALMDGMVFSGGADYAPELYGAEPHPETRPCAAARARTDLRLARLVLDETRLPVLGICLGHQLLCITMGGSLIQHLPEAEKHKSLRPGLDREHPARLATDSRLGRLFQRETIQVNSAHHQGADPRALPTGLVATAWDDDGLIEAVEGLAPDRFVLGVQWHPERIRDAEHRRALFAAFLDACRERPGL